MAEMADKVKFKCPQLGEMTVGFCLERQRKKYAVCMGCNLGKKTARRYEKASIRKETGVWPGQMLQAAKEEEMGDRSNSKRCKYPGCDKWPWRAGYCVTHLREKEPELYEKYAAVKRENRAKVKGGNGAASNVTVKLTLPREEYEELARLAQEELRPLQFQIRWLIRKGLDAQKT